MTALKKFLLGCIATFLLGWIWFVPMGGGQRFVDTLGVQASNAVGEIVGGTGVTAQMDAGKVLTRRVLLNGGAAPQAERDRIAAEVAARTSGVAGARWVDENLGAAQIINDTGKAATTEEASACQSKVLAALSSGQINFTSGGAELAAASDPVLDSVAAALGPCAGTRVEVGGHTDDEGDSDSNMRLSEERANAVVAALMQRGIPATRLSPKGYGSTKPLDSSGTAAALAKNRRIEMTVVPALVVKE